MPFEYASEFVFSSIYMISSLYENQKGITRRLVDDLVPLSLSWKLHFELIEPHSASDFRAKFAAIIRQSKEGVGAILHLDMHGSIERGLKVIESGEFIDWSDFSYLCTKLNLHMRLCIIAPVCHGLSQLYHVDIASNAPFHVLIAPEGEIQSGFIEDNMIPFYAELLETGDIAISYEAHASKNMQMMHSDELFLIAMAQYFRRRCFGRGGNERRERLLTNALSNKPNTRQSRRYCRRKIKEFTEPKPSMFDRYARSFLCGKPPSYTFKDAVKLARNS